MREREREKASGFEESSKAAQEGRCGSLLARQEVVKLPHAGEDASREASMPISMHGCYYHFDNLRFKKSQTRQK